ncbi:MAG TPA: hypothetical protein VFE51_00630 [Verrucomicrobiae bacterium]|nr:hypothetical protein [Verrucomicrobiae bacterium]
MKCRTHPGIEAVAACPYCGSGLCPDCVRAAGTPRLACSKSCAEALQRNEQALTTILHQTVRSAQASAFYCYLCAALSGGAAVVAWFMLPSPFLILFTAGCALVLLVSGIWYSRASRKKNM